MSFWRDFNALLTQLSNFIRKSEAVHAFVVLIDRLDDFALRSPYAGVNAARVGALQHWRKP